MNRSVSETARVLEVSTQQTKDWAWTFKEHLSTSANPGKGHPRRFTDSDSRLVTFAKLTLAARRLTCLIGGE